MQDRERAYMHTRVRACVQCKVEHILCVHVFLSYIYVCADLLSLYAFSEVPRIWDAGIAIESRACVINMCVVGV